MEEYIGEYRQFTDQPVRSNWDVAFSNHDLEASQEANLLRIVQESLVNARKHSKANEVTVSLTVEDDFFYLRVQDNGYGFGSLQVRQVRRPRSGIRSMGERAESMPAGAGTTVTTLVPRSQDSTRRHAYLNPLTHG